MVKQKYGEFSENQIKESKELLRKRIFFLLLVAEDLETRTKFPNVDLKKAHSGIMWRISGLNSLLNYPTELVTVLSLLEEAKNELETDFDFAKYRKLILDAGSEIMKVNESEV